MTNYSIVRILIVSVSLVLCGCEDSGELPTGSIDNQRDAEPYSRDEVSDDHGEYTRCNSRIGEQLIETTWFMSGLPVIRTRWQPNGYGHLFDFAKSGSLVSVSEARSGIKHGLELHFDESGNIVGRRRFKEGQEIPAVDENNPYDAPPVDLELKEFFREGEAGLYVSLREYSRLEQVVESRWYLNDGTLAMRSEFGADNYGHSFYFHPDGSIKTIAEARFGLFDGLALRFSQDGDLTYELWVNGVVVCSR